MINNKAFKEIKYKLESLKSSGIISKYDIAQDIKDPNIIRIYVISKPDTNNNISTEKL